MTEKIMSSKLRELVPSFVAGGLLLSAVAFYATTRYGSMHNAISAWRNEQLVVESPNVSVGKVKPLTSVTARFTILNLSKRPISIVGDYIECNCVNCDTVWPVRMEPASQIQIDYSMYSPASSGKFSQTIILYTDSATRKEIPLSISGETREVSESDPVRVEPEKDIR